MKHDRNGTSKMISGVLNTYELSAMLSITVSIAHVTPDPIPLMVPLFNLDHTSLYSYTFATCTFIEGTSGIIIIVDLDLPLLEVTEIQIECPQDW